MENVTYAGFIFIKNTMETNQEKINRIEQDYLNDMTRQARFFKCNIIIPNLIWECSKCKAEVKSTDLICNKCGNDVSEIKE